MRPSALIRSAFASTVRNACVRRTSLSRCVTASCPTIRANACSLSSISIWIGASPPPFSLFHLLSMALVTSSTLTYNAPLSRPLAPRPPYTGREGFRRTRPGETACLGQPAHAPWHRFRVNKSEHFEGVAESARFRLYVYSGAPYGIWTYLRRIRSGMMPRHSASDCEHSQSNA
jgi:hypothetical protein